MTAAEVTGNVPARAKNLGRCVLALMMGLMAHASPAQPAGPAFDCRKMTSALLAQVCASPELSALDRELADVYRQVLLQPGIASTSAVGEIQADEARWRLQIRDACADAACLRLSYRDRIDALRDRSLQAASPPAFADTRPFAVDSALWAKVRAVIGRGCPTPPTLPPGFEAAPGWLRPIVQYPHAAILPVLARRVPFALLQMQSADVGCTVTDVVALPPPSNGPAGANAPQTWACSLDGGEQVGFGAGLDPHGRRLQAVWRIDADAHRLRRVAVHVSGGAPFSCTQPESGE